MDQGLQQQNECSPENIRAAYQVTIQWFVAEQQLIWSRTYIFVTLNALVVAMLQFLPRLPPQVYLVAPLGGVLFSVCWHHSMGRMWIYHKFLICLMREQEEKLGLKEIGLGPFSRGKTIIDASGGADVGGEKMKFPPSVGIFRAKVMSDTTTWLFGIVYTLFFAWAVWRLHW